MFFDTPVYFVFLVLVVLIYWGLTWRAQNHFLLVASYFFYGWWDWRFLILILISTSSITIALTTSLARENPDQRRLLLTISLVVNLGFLGFFKYFNFFQDSFIRASAGRPGSIRQPDHSRDHPAPGHFLLHVPGGCLHRRRLSQRQKPADRFVDYALFISLFPHLIAGPIQRPSHLLPQVQNARTFDRELLLRWPAC